jgi:hypothetical protein
MILRSARLTTHVDNLCAAQVLNYPVPHHEVLLETPDQRFQ